jgi:hypothetical protein
VGGEKTQSGKVDWKLGGVGFAGGGQRATGKQHIPQVQVLVTLCALSLFIERTHNNSINNTNTNKQHPALTFP